LGASGNILDNAVNVTNVVIVAMLCSELYYLSDIVLTETL